MTVVYKRKTASQKEVYRHLQACDRDFIPPLSSRVDLHEYASKIVDKAISFEAWDGPVLVGMVNAYFNDLSSRVAFITNVSVLQSHTSIGIASALLEICLRHANMNGFATVKLEVSPANSPAFHLYSKAGFRVVGRNGDNLVMVREIIDSSVEESR
jgi:ribosomal protein S18 acetylase RimI-like enzyme